MAVSLYDITDLENPEPLITRAKVNADHAWSEARYDDRAFSVLENAISVPGPDAEPETGLVLLPFSGYADDRDTYIAGVQIFTFSDSSLTQRGVMEHGSWVRRTFKAEQTTANLSDSELSFFNTADPDQPQRLGSLALAPNYTDFLVFGDYGARLVNSRDDYWWWGNSTDLPNNQLEIVPLNDHPDTAQALARLELPWNAQVYQVETLLVSVSAQYNETTQQYETRLDVTDLADPTQPRLAGSLVTDQLQPAYPWHGGYEDCFDCGYYPYPYNHDSAYAVGQSLVFPGMKWESKILGTEQICHTYADEREQCESNEPPQCVIYDGAITCRSLNGGPMTCSGTIQRCEFAEKDWSCEEVDANSINTTTRCWDRNLERHWSHYDLQVVDLSNPEQPDLRPPISMPKQEEAVGLLALEDSLYLSYKIPTEVEQDSRPFVRYYFKQVDLSDPHNPQVGSGINVPGQLIQIDGDTVFTQDFLWGENVVESSVNKLKIVGNKAVLKAKKRFENRLVDRILLDGVGHLLVSHREDYDHWSDVLMARLTFVDAEGDLNQLAEVDIDAWASLQDAKVGRALFQVPGGLLVINLDQASNPFAQAFFPVLGWPYRLLISGNDILFPAGRYGIYRFDIDTFNLE